MQTKWETALNITCLAAVQIRKGRPALLLIISKQNHPSLAPLLNDPFSLQTSSLFSNKPLVLSVQGSGSIEHSQ